MARPRTLDDDEILDRFTRFLVDRTSTQPWTLAEAGERIGLSPAGLLKRFGSRTGLVAALSRRWIASIPTQPLRPDEPNEELRAWVEGKVGTEEPTVLAVRLSQLIDDLSDPLLAGLLREGWVRERAYVALLLGGHDLARLHYPERGAAILLDALTGALLRHGVGDLPHTHPTDILTSFLEAWT